MSAEPVPGRPVQARQSDEAFERLRDAIRRCELVPGAVVTEAQLASASGLGRPAVRTACDRLAQVGLLRPMPRQGHQVAPIRLRDLKNSFQLRLLLEPVAARLAVGRVDTDVLAAIDARCAKGYSPNDPASISSLLEANTAFRTMIARACGNERMGAVIIDLIEDQERLFHAGFGALDGRTGMRHQHEAIVDAFSRRDAAAAEATIRAHAETAQSMLMEGLMNSASLLDIALVPPGVAAHG